MPSQQTPVTAYVSDKIAERLKRAAAAKRQTTSEYMRRLLEHHFEFQPTEMPRRGRPPKESEPAEQSA